MSKEFLTGLVIHAAKSWKDTEEIEILITRDIK